MVGRSRSSGESRILRFGAKGARGRRRIERIRRFAVLPVVLVMLVGFCSLAANPVEALSISARTNRSELSLDDQLVFTVTISSNETQQLPQPNLPGSIDGFAIASGPNQQTSIQIVNFQMTSQAQFTYILMPQKKGTFTIPAVTVTFEGKTISTEPIPVTVTDTPNQNQTQSKSQPGQSGRNQASGSSSQVDQATLSFFRLEVSKQKVFLGEQITLDYVLYTRENVVDLGLKNNPKLTGFWVEDVDLGGIQQARTTIDGVEYNRAVLKEQILFPTTAGTQTIEAIALSLQVAVRSRSRSVFDDFFNDPFLGTRSQPKYLNSRPLDIVVQPLPEAGKPADFNGMVGDYSLAMKANRTEVKRGDSVTLTVTISGTGNVQGITEPVFPDIPGIKMYSPTVSKKSQNANGRVTGSKSFEYIAIPTVEGSVTLPALEISYFSPANNRYRRATTKDITLNVLKNDTADSAAPLIAAGPVGMQKDVTLIGQDINYIKLTADRLEPDGGILLNRIGFWLLQVLPLLLIVGVAGRNWRRQVLNKDVAGSRARQARGAARKLLKNATKAKQKGTMPEFYALLGKAMTGYLADKLNVAEAGITSDQIRTALNERNVDDKLITAIMSILDQCDFARFAPASLKSEDMESFLEQAADAINSLERLKLRG